MESRPCKREEFNDWKRFLDENFGYTSPQSYVVDFAPLFEAGSLSSSRLLWDRDQIIASGTLYPVTAVIKDETLRLAIVGAVATHQEYRGKGFSRKVLTELEAAALQSRDTSEAKGLILWSDRYEFYEKLGYRKVGLQEIYGLSDLRSPTFWPEGTPIYGWDWAQVKELYEKHPMRVARTDRHWNALKDIKSCTRLQWITNDGTVLAYIGIDRGQDLHGIIHEWGGDPQALHCLVTVALKNRPSLLWLTHPKSNDWIRSQLPSSALVHSGHLALLKPFSEISEKTLEQLWFWGLDSL
ncbi:MAG: GNAT family N-acetyltransferase [Bdellovibrionota bacterium]